MRNDLDLNGQVSLESIGTILGCSRNSNYHSQNLNLQENTMPEDLLDQEGSDFETSLAELDQFLNRAKPVKKKRRSRRDIYDDPYAGMLLNKTLLGVPAYLKAGLNRISEGGDRQTFDQHLSELHQMLDEKEENNPSQAGLAEFASWALPIGGAAAKAYKSGRSLALGSTVAGGASGFVRGFTGERDVSAFSRDRVISGGVEGTTNALVGGGVGKGIEAKIQHSARQKRSTAARKGHETRRQRQVEKESRLAEAREKQRQSRDQNKLVFEYEKIMKTRPKKPLGTEWQDLYKNDPGDAIDQLNRAAKESNLELDIEIIAANVGVSPAAAARKILRTTFHADLKNLSHNEIFQLKKRADDILETLREAKRIRRSRQRRRKKN